MERKSNNLIIIPKIEKYIEYLLTILLKLPRTEKYVLYRGINLKASGFVLFGGNYNNNSNNYPLADANSINNPNNDYNNSVGELVL